MATANERIIQMVQSGQITPQQADQFFQQAGVNVGGGGGARTRYLESNPQIDQQLNNMLSAYGSGGRGAIPIGVEPLHEWEKQGLTTQANPGLLGGGGMVEGQQRIRDYLANPQGGSQAYMSPEAKQALQKSLGMFDKADTSLQQGTSAITGSDFDRYMNPFQKQVTDVALAQLEEDYGKARDARSAEINRRPSASFGDLFGAEKMAEIEGQRIKSRAEIPATYGYQGWQDSLAAIQGEKGRYLQAGQTYGGLGSSLGNVSTQAQGVQSDAMNAGLKPISMLYDTGVQGTQVGFDAADRKIAAGGAVRGYNQSLADITMNDYMQERAFPRTNLSQTMEMIPSFAPQSYQGVQQQTTGNVAGGVGQALSAIGGTSGINNTAVGRWFGGL
jgi:hypothetical protein